MVGHLEKRVGGEVGEGVGVFPYPPPGDEDGRRNPQSAQYSDNASIIAATAGIEGEGHDLRPGCVGQLPGRGDLLTGCYAPMRGCGALRRSRTTLSCKRIVPRGRWRSA